MKKLRILVTTIGGLTSPDGLLALRHNGEREVFLVGCDAFSGACGRHFVDRFFISPDSAQSEESYIEALLKATQEYGIDIIVPCGNEDNLALAKHKSRFSVPIMVGEYTDLIQAYDKGAVYEILLQKMPKHAPKYRLASDYETFLEAIYTLGHPHKLLVVKPRFGRGGRGVYVLSEHLRTDIFSNKPDGAVTLSFFEAALKGDNELIIMEHLRAPFISAYSLCSKGRNLFTMRHIREWGNASQTYRGSVDYDKELEELCSGVISAFRLDFTNNMELAYNESGDLVLFDLNPRLGASSGIDTHLGLNFPYLALKLALGEEIALDRAYLMQQKARFYRYFTQWWENGV